MQANELSGRWSHTYKVHQGQISSEILIAGEGITGISAAIEGAKTGYTVPLVEKEEALGGKQKELYKQYPSQAPFQTLADPVLDSTLR